MPKKSPSGKDDIEKDEDWQEEWDEKEEDEVEEDEDIEDEEDVWEEEKEESSDVEEPEVDEYDLTQIPGVSRDLAKRLKNEGFESLWDIAYADIEWITEVKGIDKETAEKMIEMAKKLLRLN